MPPLTLRLRMILLFCVVIGVFLAGTYVAVYLSFVHEIREDLDDRLLDTAKPIMAEVVSRPVASLFAGAETEGQLLELVGLDGIVVERSHALEGLNLLIRSLPSGSQASFQTLESGAGRLRAAFIPIRIRDRGYLFMIAEPTAKVEQVVATFRERAFGLWTVSLLLTTLIAVWYVGRSLAPIVDLSRHAALLTAQVSSATHEDLNASLPVVNPSDEVGVLATNFNVLFARLGAVVRQLRQFVSDAAHELRTPLSVVRGETQFLLSQPRSVEEYQRILRTIDEELTLMVGIIEGLFTLSMADAGQLRLVNERLRLDEVIEEACGIATPGARRKQVRIERSEVREVEFLGDPALLCQLFLILLENAVKYSPSNTTIRVSLGLVGDHPEAVVRDEGFGIAAEHLPHIFERFYRATAESNDEARSGGLGLAIAQAIVQAHGGEIRCKSEVGQGSVFTVAFPALGGSASVRLTKP